MDIETLKRAAEFLGYTVSCGSLWEDGFRQMELEDFHPESDANLLKQMEEKLSSEQRDSYYLKMQSCYYKFNVKVDFAWWFKCEAETKLCFEKLMECV